MDATFPAERVIDTYALAYARGGRNLKVFMTTDSGKGQTTDVLAEQTSNQQTERDVDESVDEKKRADHGVVERVVLEELPPNVFVFKLVIFEVG